MSVWLLRSPTSRCTARVRCSITLRGGRACGRESVLAPFGLRQCHLVALTVLRARGGSTQQALSSTLMMDGTNVVGLLNDLEAEQLIERRRSPQDRCHVVDLAPHRPRTAP
jgi:DNA-binding MarR family transcriptional regulator